MFKCTKMFWVLALMPVFANAAYDINFDYNGSQDYIKDARGECTGEHFLLGDLGGIDQNACETACDARSLCTGYSFKSGSCMLKKNITLCSAQDWKTTTGYEYFSKPLELDFVISTQITTLKPAMLTDAAKNPIKYCLQVPAKAKEGDKLETVKCSTAQGHKGQTYTLEEVTPATNPKTYKIKHLESGLCVDLLEFLVDDNPTRLWNCNLSAETLVRQQRQHFKFQSTEIPKGMENYTPFKIRLNTTHDLSTVSDYLMISTGNCTGVGSVISNFTNKTPDECAQECNKVTECKGLSYNYTAKSCDLVKDATDCPTRVLGDTYFYTKKSAL